MSVLLFSLFKYSKWCKISDIICNFECPKVIHNQIWCTLIDYIDIEMHITVDGVFSPPTFPNAIHAFTIEGISTSTSNTLNIYFNGCSVKNDKMIALEY